MVRGRSRLPQYAALIYSLFRNERKKIFCDCIKQQVRERLFAMLKRPGRITYALDGFGSGTDFSRADGVELVRRFSDGHGAEG